MNTKIKLILLAYSVYILQFVSTHYYEPDGYYQNPGQQEYYEYDEMDEYDTEPRHHRRRYGDKAQRYNHYYPDDCSDKIQECSCSSCDNPSPCCQTFCASCPYISGQPNLFFVPYPYPFMVPGTEQNATDFNQQKLSQPNREPPTTTTTTTTTTEKVTTTKVVLSSDVQRNGEDFEMTVVKAPVKLKGSSRYMLTSLRRTKPTWVPKYGIVPIPDNLAEKLMSQLREVKEYNYRAKESLV